MTILSIAATRILSLLLVQGGRWSYQSWGDTLGQDIEASFQLLHLGPHSGRAQLLGQSFHPLDLPSGQLQLGTQHLHQEKKSTISQFIS